MAACGTCGNKKQKLFEDGDGQGYCGQCWEKYYKRAPLHDVTLEVTVRRDPSAGVGVKLTGLEISAVETGSPASVAGLIPKVVLTHVNGKELSSAADLRKESEGRAEFTVRALAPGHQRRTGKVREWRPEGFGFIEPDLPIFLAPGALGASERSVFVGDCWVFPWGVQGGVRLREGLEVEFRVEVDKGGPKGPRLVATAVTGRNGAKLEASKTTGERKERLLSAVEDMVKAAGGRPWKDTVCMYHAAGMCSINCGKMHLKGLAPPEGPAVRTADLMVQVSRAKLGLLQEKWKHFMNQPLVRAWELRNEALTMRFRATQYNMTVLDGKKPDMIEGFHGTAEQNVLSIATQGFDPLLRSGQVYGAGEYFAKSPQVSEHYCNGGAFMFMCQLVLGEQDVDHIWVDDMKYYVLKQREGQVQALPQYLLQFRDSASPLAKELSEKTVTAEDDKASFLAMQAMQKGGGRPCRDRTEGTLEQARTRHVHLGWLDSKLLQHGQKELEADVTDFLRGHGVKKVIEDRNGTRVGAFVELKVPITQEQFGELNTRLYHGKYRISVDDESPRVIAESRRVCPKLTGPGKYCRGWNLAGHGGAWWESCKFQHPAELFTTYKAKYTVEPVLRVTAKWDEVEGLLLRELVGVKVVGMERIVNPALERHYESRLAFLRKKHGAVEEKELWHGTNCQALETILQKGLVSPSDRQAAKKCPVSGGKGLSTTLCGTDCKLCVEPHEWHMCHMFGLGIYLADSAAKSHRYVSAPKMVDGRPVHTLLRCRVNLGNPYLIEGGLKEEHSMHNFSWCRNPAEALTHVTQKWDGPKGHDAFYVKGLGHGAKSGKAVVNSEYVVFHNHQVLPLYAVHYVP